MADFDVEGNQIRRKNHGAQRTLQCSFRACLLRLSPNRPHARSWADLPLPKIRIVRPTMTARDGILHAICARTPYKCLLQACSSLSPPGRPHTRSLIGSTDSMVSSSCDLRSLRAWLFLAFWGRRLIGLQLRAWTSHLIVTQS